MYMDTHPLGTGHKIDLGTYMSCVGLERLALKSDSDSDHLDD
jgi:hypothetical protein